MAEPLAQFYFTAEEIEALERVLTVAIGTIERMDGSSDAEHVQAYARRLLVVYYSLRTALAEGRYGLERQTESPAGAGPSAPEEVAPDADV